jgi:small-conductance mechanosensitive channel
MRFRTINPACAWRRAVLVCVALIYVLLPALAVGQGTAAGAAQEGSAVPPTGAPVLLEGHEAITVHVGNTQLTVEERAAAISSRLKDWADQNHGQDAQSELKVLSSPEGTALIAGNTILVGITPEDAKAEGKPAAALAKAWGAALADAVNGYRAQRTVERRAMRWVAAVAILFIAVLLVMMLGRSRLWVTRRAEESYERHAQVASSQGTSRILLQSASGAAKKFIARAIGLVWLIGCLLVIYFACHMLLYLFPATRPKAVEWLNAVLTPINSFGWQLWKDIPSLIFVVIVGVVAWYSIKFSKFYFEQIRTGVISFESFRPSWATTTQRLVTVGIVLLAVLIAYPYIPGSQSEAFKGLSIFVGVVVSIGSSGSVSNVIGGIMLTYTGAFEVDDIVKVGETTGWVSTMGVLTTRIRTRKNEFVSIPNSVVLASQIVNYSDARHDCGVVLGASAGIGYDTPWRQVEAMMLMAADRSEGVRKSPPAAVLQLSLNSFDITYELNAFMEDGRMPAVVLSEMHKNIQDVFNEYGVQIMTPMYRMDPPDAKVVPKEKLYEAPAVAPVKKTDT